MNADREALEELKKKVGPGWKYETVDHLVPQYSGRRTVVQARPTALDSVDEKGYSFTVIWPKEGRLFSIEGNEICYFSNYGPEPEPSITLKFSPPLEGKDTQ